MKKKGFIVKNILKIAIILIYIFSVTIIVTAAPEFSVDPNATDPSPTVIEKFEEIEEPTTPVVNVTEGVEETTAPTVPENITTTESTESQIKEETEQTLTDNTNNETIPPELEEPKPPEQPQKPVENFPVYSPVDEYLYIATDTLNVRKGPSTNHDKIGQLKQNDYIHRIGIYDDNWSVIEYDGQKAFVWSDYLSINKIEKKMGTAGRLTIPTVGVDVALYNASLYGGSQGIVDARDSAAYMQDACGLYNSILIADHWNQGFDAMKRSVPDATKAYIKTSSGTIEYICVANFTGHNTGRDLTDNDYKRITNLYSDGLIMYTCNDHWSNVTITFWAPISSYGRPDTYLPTEPEPEPEATEPEVGEPTPDPTTEPTEAPTIEPTPDVTQPAIVPEETSPDETHPPEETFPPAHPDE